MAELKKILVVDDHFEMLEFLRSMLQLSNPDHEVLGVPSAEEGLLELHSVPFDLLITDVRLPGMSGFELVRKARRLRDGLPVLMITAYATAQGRQEAQDLGVYRYFEKPLDTDALLAAVHATLYEREEQQKAGDTTPFERQKMAGSAGRAEVITPEKESWQASGTAQDEKKIGAKTNNALEVKRRLQSLLTDTGAVDALLTGREGRIMYRAGRREQPMAQLARLLTRSLVDSFELAEVLQSAEPFTIQYQAGEAVDVYGANIGRDYFLILLFDARARRGRIGTVWVFAQRTVKELRELLPGASGKQVVDKPEARETATPWDKAPHDSERVAAERTPNRNTARERPAQEVVIEERGDLDEGETLLQDPLDSAGDEDGGEKLLEADVEAEHEDLFDLLREAGAKATPDLDSFWEEAAADLDGKTGRGMSFEEAVKMGLLPPDLRA